MKKALIWVFVCCMLMFPPYTANASGALNYRYQMLSLRGFLQNNDYIGFIDSVHLLAAEHPLIMPEEWEYELVSLAQQYLEGISNHTDPVDLNSEYDIFDDITYMWFGDHRSATVEDNCVIVHNKAGDVLSFCMPMSKWILIDHYVAVVNGDTRISGSVEAIRDYDADYNKYEMFDIPIRAFEKIESIDSLALRFYGDNENEYVDYYLDGEEIDDLNKFRTMYDDDKSLPDVDAVLSNWAKAIDNVKDTSIPPADFYIFLKNDYPIYPVGTTVEMLHNTASAEKDGIKKTLVDGKFATGSVYFLPCTINDITEPSEMTPQSAWIVNLKGQYNTNGRISARIVVDHALEMDWIDQIPNIGDEIILVATYLGMGNASFMPVFFLGADDHITQEISAYYDKN